MAKKRSPTVDLALRLFWFLGCALTLGYASKYYRKILPWQVYDPARKDKNYRAYTLNLNSSKLGLKTSIRAKQQLSVITATSAAALAIPSPFGTPNIYWVATACFSGAFGLSLEGLIIITYLTVFGAGSSPETIGRIANGKGFLKGMVGPVAIVTALPTAITTYSSLFLLTGLLAMTIAAGEGSSIRQHMRAFKAIVLVPVFTMLLCLVLTVAGCEFFAWKEGSARQNGDVEMGGITDGDSPTANAPILAHDPQGTTAHAFTEEPATHRVTFENTGA
ncbi:hypothetical protein FRC10_002501 [Ceratobasidium sp. 414]|nr:hypothetical protein FRC10_002501 [Ceratobasidium sp. 414]